MFRRLFEQQTAINDYVNKLSISKVHVLSSPFTEHLVEGLIDLLRLLYIANMHSISLYRLLHTL